ncbi:MAG TPA: hypothetical protein VGP13_01350 [Candidatus Paceibacterota bacterium]|jgi:hypothetical protein|nr:hypothetical protein [Candidatus Paceibacterota bacterium]
MKIPSEDELKALLDELRGKNISSVDPYTELSERLARGEDIRIEILGTLHSDIDGGFILEEQADPYIARLGFNEDELKKFESCRNARRKLEAGEKKLN